MLIYNSKKEFLGIDESDLTSLGYTNFSQMRLEAADFADLFVKTPGYIHNFKHVHWIDFITCADSTETPRVIINANTKNYRANLIISTAYLVDNQDAKAYLVTLQNLRELTGNEVNDFATDIAKKPDSRPIQTLEDQPIISKIETQLDQSSNKQELNLATDIDERDYSQEIIEDEYDDQTLSSPLDINFDTDDEPTSVPQETSEIKQKKLEIREELEIQDIPILEDEFTSDYVFDPKIASNELGLPIDLIEEFIDDFIAQSKEFKDNLYESLNDGDIDNVKILSHKLKGVAANLRIEDAFEVLTTINTSSDINIIRKNLNHFYIIIAKLAGEEISTPNPKTPQKTEDKESLEPTKTEENEEENETEESMEDDDFVLDFKDDLLKKTPSNDSIEPPVDEEIELIDDEVISINDSDVPEKIDVAELADDDFLNNEPLEIDEKNLALDLESVDEEELSKDISIMEELPDHLDPELLDIEPNTTEDTDEVSVEIHYDKKKTAREIGIDQESFDELFEDYLLDASDFSSNIEDAINKKDQEQWKKEAIKLKGMSDNMRINTFTSELETLLNTSNVDEATAASEHIKIYLSKLSTMEA